MRLDLLRIKHLRNLSELEIHPGEGINLIMGRNGAGKTSVLESIYMIGRGRSFRGARAGPLISEGYTALEVYARALEGLSSARSIGIWRSKSKMRVRVDGRNLEKLSHLARIVPIQLISTQSHKIFEGGPRFRRRLLDWGVFHVEPEYQDLYARFRVLISQRNAALKAKRGDVKVWDAQFVETSERIHLLRSRYLSALLPVFRSALGNLSELPGIAVEYVRGWPMREDLPSVLRKSLAGDQRRGYTQFGPHKADLLVFVGTTPIERMVSRGQQKLVIAALLLSQALLLEARCNASPILLFDDIGAELDKENLQRLLGYISTTGLQAFVSANENVLGHYEVGGGAVRNGVFHVEHGKITKLG